MILLLEKTIKITLLFDYYGALLTNKQRKIFDLYYFQDLSLAEAAEKLDVSRQAVYDHLQRGEKLLNQYENKLGLAGKANNIRNKIDDILKKLKLNSHSAHKIKEIRNDLNSIKKNL